MRGRETVVMEAKATVDVGKKVAGRKKKTAASEELYIYIFSLFT